LRKTHLIAYVVAFLLFVHSAWSDPVAIDLQRCVRTAVARNQAILSAASDVKAGEARITEANAPQLPNVHLFYNYDRALNPLGEPIVAAFGTFQSAPFYLSTYKDGVTFSQLLFDGQKTSALVKQQKSLTEAARSDYRLTSQTIAYSAISAFYQLAISREMVKVSQQNLNDAEDHLKLAQARYKAGIAPRSDVVFARVPVATAQLNLTQAEETAKASEASLDRVMAYDVTTPIIIQKVTDLSYPVTEEKAFQIALATRDEIKRAERDVDAAKAQLQSARGGYWPVLSAVADYGYVGYGPSGLPGNLGYDVGFQATYPIFQGNLQSGQVAEAKALLNKNITALDAAKQDVFLDVRQSFVAFQSAEESVREAQAEQDSALENLHAMEGEYKAGLVPILNLTDSQASYIQAETHSLAARLNDQTAVARLMLSMGLNLEESINHE